jgi:broad specificity phosphatase PhoE
VVLVSHQLPIWIGRRALEGRRLWHRPDRRICGLASVTSLTYAEDRLVSIGYREPAAALVTQAGPPGA